MENTTGRRTAAATRPTIVLRLLAGAFALLGLVALTAVLATTHASAGGVAKLTVNSTSNTDDGRCNGPPNDTTVGNCTLREAFNEVNAGRADEINFHTAVFPQATHGVIQLELGLGPLPPLVREVRIDAKGVGVVLDGDYDNDGIGVPWGIVVIASHNAFDFELNGGGSTFIIQEIGCGRIRGGAGDESVSGFVISCASGSGNDGVSANVPFFGGVGILISGMCGFDNLGGNNVSGPNLCCQGQAGESIQGETFLCPDGEADESVSGPPIFVGGPWSLGNIRIDGIEIHDAYASTGILMEATNVNNVNVTNSWIEADLDGIGIFTFSPPAPPNGELHDNNVHINGNRITGGASAFFLGAPADGENQVSGLGPGAGSGVDIDFCCNLGSTITADVSNNASIIGNTGNGVWLTYCLVAACESANGSSWLFTINNNGKISGQNDAINVEINSNDNPANSPLLGLGSHLNASIEIKGNAIMDGVTDDGIDTAIDICCANSDSHGSIVIEENEDIVGDDNGVDVNQFICCTADNVSYTSVSRNGKITGEGDDGVDVEVHAGSGDTVQDSDENTTTVDIIANDDISGDDGEAVDIEASSGKLDDAGDADRNVTNVNIIDNDHLDGDDNGVQVFAFAGTQGGPGDADDNEATLTFTSNDDVDGADDDGIDVEVAAGTTAGLGGPVNTTGDHNSATALINDNDDIKGHDGDGVDVFVFAGGASDTSEGNATTTQVIGNDDIHAFQGGDGIHTENVACCDADGSGTNDITISQNDNVIGHDGDGIDVDTICCSFNTVMIQENDNVRGDDGQGIEITPCLASGDATAPDELVLADVTCMADSITILNITDNNIVNSGLDGILICCGLFQFPATQAPPDGAGAAGAVFKSVIADNRIIHNGEDGIDLDTTIGINVVHNTVSGNGTAVLDGDNGIEIDWQFAYDIWEGNNDIPSSTFKVPAHFNRISQNSTFDNVGLGINLISDVTVLLPVYAPGSGTENSSIADGVGCTSYAETPITPNDCIPYPKLLFTGGPSIAKVSGTACANCHVEIFLADPTPTDQTGPLDRQFGEGRTYLITATADDLGTFSINLPCGLSGGGLTATATDKLKNTSEFSSNVPFPGTPGCPAATEQPGETPAPTSTSGPAEPTATPVAPTATATAGPSALCGDVNSDGVVNSIDASIILQKAAAIIGALPKGEASGDVNSDGVANSIDASIILQMAAAMIGPAGLHCS